MPGPSATNLVPANHALSVSPTVTVQFDLVAAGSGLPSVLTSLDGRWAEETIVANGSAADWSLSAAYVAGTVEAWMVAPGLGSLGVRQIVNELGSPDFSTADGSAPAAGSILTVRYQVDYAITSVALAGTVVTFNGVPVFSGGAWQPGFNGVISPIAYGYQFQVTAHPAFTPGVVVTVVVTALDLAGAMGVSTWDFLPDTVVEVDDLGGRAFTRAGIFLAVDSTVDVMVGATPVRAYSGVSGHGDTIRAAAGSVTFVVPPLPVGGPYGLQVHQAGGGTVVLDAVFLVRPHQFGMRQQALRGVFPPWWAVGPRHLDSVPLQV